MLEHLHWKCIRIKIIIIKSAWCLPFVHSLNFTGEFSLINWFKSLQLKSQPSYKNFEIAYEMLKLEKLENLKWCSHLSLSTQYIVRMTHHERTFNPSKLFDYDERYETSTVSWVCSFVHRKMRNSWMQRARQTYIEKLSLPYALFASYWFDVSCEIWIKTYDLIKI